MEQQSTKKLTIATEDRINSIYIAITDTGCGISPENISDIFDPFITYTHKGSGLGLAIVKKIIEEHHGTITVSSELGKGTAFTINLPKSQPSFQKEKTI